MVVRSKKKNNKQYLNINKFKTSKKNSHGGGDKPKKKKKTLKKNKKAKSILTAKNVGIGVVATATLGYVGSKINEKKKKLQREIENKDKKIIENNKQIKRLHEQKELNERNNKVTAIKDNEYNNPYEFINIFIQKQGLDSPKTPSEYIKFLNQHKANMRAFYNKYHGDNNLMSNLSSLFNQSDFDKYFENAIKKIKAEAIRETREKLAVQNKAYTEAEAEAKAKAKKEAKAKAKAATVINNTLKRVKAKAKAEAEAEELARFLKASETHTDFLTEKKAKQLQSNNNDEKYDDKKYKSGKAMLEVYLDDYNTDQYDFDIEWFKENKLYIYNFYDELLLYNENNIKDILDDIKYYIEHRNKNIY